MRVNKLTFREAEKTNPVTKNEQTYITITGIVTVILFFWMIMFPFWSSWCRGKIGINTLDNNKYNLVSTALRHADRRSRLYVLAFMVSAMILYYQKGFFKNFDIRVSVVFVTLLMGIGVISLTYIIPERFLLHNVIGVGTVICGASIVYFVDQTYATYFVDQELESIHNLTISLTIFMGLTFLIGLFNIYNNYLRKIKLFPGYIPMVRNILGFLEVIVFIIIGSVFAVMIKYPPLE